MKKTTWERAISERQEHRQEIECKARMWTLPRQGLAKA